MTRALILTGLIVCLPTLAQAEPDAEPAAMLAAGPLLTSSYTLPLQGDFYARSTNNGLDHRRRIGALIGAAVGAGIVLFSGGCEGRATDCLGAMAVLAGMGAGIGAWVAGPSLRAPTVIPEHRRVVLSPLVSRRPQGGVVAVGF